MREQTFTTEIMRSLKLNGGWAYKIPDFPTSWVKARSRFTISKPCDIVAVLDGVTLFIETKQIKSWKAFGLRDMRPAQIEALTKIEQRGGNALVFLNVRFKGCNKMISFRWGELQKRFEKGSIKAVELKKLPAFESKTVDKKIIFDFDLWEI